MLLAHALGAAGGLAQVEAADCSILAAAEEAAWSVGQWQDIEGATELVTVKDVGSTLVFTDQTVRCLAPLGGGWIRGQELGVHDKTFARTGDNGTIVGVRHKTGTEDVMLVLRLAPGQHPAAMGIGNDQMVVIGARDDECATGVPVNRVHASVMDVKRLQQSQTLHKAQRVCGTE